MKQFYRLARVARWKVTSIGDRRFVLLLSFFVGLISGLAAVLLKNLVHETNNFLFDQLGTGNLNYLYLAFPLIGIFLTVIFVKYFLKEEDIGHGVSKILYAISKKNGKIRSHNNYSSMIASTFTVGFGGSVGLEAPIVLTGASLGSNLGKMFGLNYKTTMLLIGCGAAGAIAGIFKAPIAAIIFALEVLMLDLTVWSIIPLLISSVTGASVSYLFLGEKVVFSFTEVDPFVLKNIIFYILLGVLCGFISLYFTRGVKRMEEGMARIKSQWNRLLIGGISLGILIFLFPPLYGEGYIALKELFSDEGARELLTGTVFSSLKNSSWWILFFLSLVVVFKVLATALTSSSGGVGGIFAPSLFMGGITGFIFSKTFNFFGFMEISSRNFTLAGMAGIMAGVMHAPLTAIFLIAEITGGYGLFIPLIVTSTVAYLTILYFEPHSIYTRRLAKRGELITHHKDKAVLKLLNIQKVIETDFKIVRPDDNLGQLVKTISSSKRNIFPVVDDNGVFLGIVALDEIRHIMFNSELYSNSFVKDLMVVPPTFVLINENMEMVMEKFEETNAWNLPVIDKEGIYKGFISKSKIFTSYRKLLVHFSDE